MTFSSYTTDLSHAHLLCYGCGLGEERIEVRRFRLVGRHHDGYLRQSRSDLVGPTIVARKARDIVLIPLIRSASRLSTDLHADQHAREHRIASRDYETELAGRLSNVASGVTIFTSAWPVQAFFLLFIACTGWTSIPWGLLLWFLVSYALTVRCRRYCRQFPLTDVITFCSGRRVDICSAQYNHVLLAQRLRSRVSHLPV
jgi:hypothetical protein